MAIDWSAARKKAKELDKETAKLTKQPSSTGRGGGTASAPKNKKPVSRNGGASPMKDSGGTKTTTTTLLPTKGNASSWVSETRSKGADQANRDRMGQMFGLTMPSATKPNAYLEQKAQERQERRRKSARSELSSLLSQTVTEENRDDLTARIRAAQQTLNETKPERKTRSLAGSFALGTENVGSGLLRGVEAPVAAVESAGYQALHDLTSLGGRAENPLSRWAERSAAGVQTLPITSAWQRSIQERYRPNETEQTVMDVTGNIASMLPSLALSAGIGAAAGAGQGAAALTAADTAAKGQRAGQLMMALQGMGSAAKEARDEGATTAQANLYGAADGLLGAATERISGGIPLLGSGVADRVVSKFATLPLDRAVADMAGEGFEEGLQTAAEPFLKRAVYDPDARNATLSEIGQSAAMGALASGALKLGIEAPQAVESGLQRYRAERPGRELSRQLDAASAQMDQDARGARLLPPRAFTEAESRAEAAPAEVEAIGRRAEERPEMGQYQRGNTVDGTASRAYDGRIDQKEDVSYDQRRDRTDDPRGYGAGENAGGAGLSGEVRTGGPVETVPVRGRYGGRGEDASYAQKPVRSWVEGHTVEPQDGSVSHAEQRAAMEYGIPSFVVDDAAWDANEKHRNGFSADGQIYIRGSIPEQARGMVTSHEANHVMRQTEYAPYLDFVDRTPGMLNFGTTDAQILLEHVAKHAGVDPASINGADMARLYDELNASVYGHIASGKMAGVEGGLRNAFRDFDAYASELSDIHRRFKEERGGGAGYGASQSPQTGRPVGPESSVGAAEKGFDPWSAFQGTKSQFYPEGPNAARPVDVPTTDADGDPVRKSASTIMGARAVTDETAGMVQDMVRQGRFSYEKNGDAGSVQRARSTIQEKGFQRSMEQYADAVRRGVVSKDMVTLGQQLLVDASNAGDVKATAELLTLYGASSTSAAQAMQAQAILRKLTPEGQLYAIQRTVQELNKSVQPTLEKRAAREAKKAEKKAKRAERMGKLLPGADGGVEQGVEQDALEQIRGKAERATGIENITISQELVEKFLKADGQEARDAVMEEIYQNVADQVPSNWEDKWRAWRYFSMLSAPRTHGRNLVGNAGGQVMRVAKDEIAAGIEAVVSKASGGKLQRTKTFGAAPSLYEAAAADFQNVAEDLSGSHFDDVKGQIQDRRTIFKKGLPTRAVEKAVQTVSGNKEFQFKRGALEAATKGNSAALGAEDTLFKKATYADALAKFLQANHVTAEQFRSGQADPDLVARGRDYASREAMKHTFNDHNDFSDAVASLGSRGAHSENAWVRRFSRAVEAVLPFKRTPANILVRGAEYSPAGLAKSLTVDLVKVKQGKMSGAEAIDNIAQGLTGTGVMLLGALLAKSGLLTGSADSDEEEAKMDELTGGQDYALNLPGGRNATLDWLAPASLPLFMGVEMYNATAERDGTDAADSALAFLGNSLKVAAKTADPMLEMTMLQSLNDILTNHSYDDGSPLGRLVASAATSYVTQALPSILGQLGRTLQDKRYTTYTDKNVTFPTTDMQYTMGKTIARLPGSDKFPGTNQVPYIDAWGREEKTGTLPERAFNNFLNPAYVSKKNETAVDKEIRRLYRATGDKSVVPDRFDKSVSIDGKKVWLDQDQYVTAAKKAGQAKYDALDKLIATDAYQKADDARKAELVDDIMEYGNAMGRMAVTDWKPAQSSWVSKAVEAEKSGIDIGTYVLYHETKDADGDGTVSQSEAAGVLLPMKGLTDAQKSALWRATDRGWNEEKDPFRGTLPTKGGLSVEQSVKVLQTYRDIDKADYTGDKVASQKQTAFSKALDGMGLTKDQRTAVDGLYKFYTMMPAKVQAYSVDTMSDAAKAAWPAVKALDMSEAAYLQVYPIVAKSEKGYTKADKIRDLMALGYSRSQANTIYSKIKSK